MTMSKFKDPQTFAITSRVCIFVQTMYIWTDAILVTFLQQCGYVFFVRLLLPVSSASAYCASSPDSRGDPRLPSRCYVLEGGFLDRLRCCWRYYIQDLTFIFMEKYLSLVLEMVDKVDAQNIVLLWAFMYQLVSHVTFSGGLWGGYSACKRSKVLPGDK